MLVISIVCVYAVYVCVQRCKCYPVDVSSGLHMSTINTKVGGWVHISFRTIINFVLMKVSVL